MVSEKAEEMLGIVASKSSKEDVAVAFWLKTDEIDKQIIDTDDPGRLEQLLEEKDQLLEARALLEGVSILQVRKEMLEKGRRPKIHPGLLIAAAVGWIVVVILVIFAVMI